MHAYWSLSSINTFLSLNEGKALITLNQGLSGLYQAFITSQKDAGVWTSFNAGDGLEHIKTRENTLFLIRRNVSFLVERIVQEDAQKSNAPR